jgi:hypothetical protein
MLALGDPDGDRPLTEARGLFASMGYEPRLSEAESLAGRLSTPSQP